MDTVGSGWEMVGRDCTEEKKKEDELPEGIDWRMTTHHNAKRITDLDKKVQELITAGQGQMKRIQELEHKTEFIRNCDIDQCISPRIADVERRIERLERELKNHYHDTGFPK